jgi:phage baseplate assembly protein W
MTTARATLLLEDLGEDVLFDDDTHVAPDGDYVGATDAVLVRQQLLTRLLVAPGEYKVMPDFGVGVARYVKKPLTSSVLAELQRRCLEQLAQEETIDRVLEVKAEAVTIDAAPVLRLTVRVESRGRELRFEGNSAFTFARAA